MNGSNSNAEQGSGAIRPSVGEALLKALAGAETPSDVAGFAGNMLREGRAIRCVGTSCRMHGAEALYRDMSGVLKQTDQTVEFETIGCLARCGHGPNLRVGKEIFRGGENKVETDTRTWVL